MNKKFFRIALLCALLGTGAAVTSCTDYDQEIAELQDQVTALDKKVSDLQSRIDAGAVITGVTTSANGVTVTLSDGKTFTLTNGKDGANGTNGTNGTDGKDGVNGEPGTNGKDGLTYVPNPETGTFWLDDEDTEISYLVGGVVKAELKDGKLIITGVEGAKEPIVINFKELTSVVYRPGAELNVAQVGIVRYAKTAEWRLIDGKNFKDKNHEDEYNAHKNDRNFKFKPENEKVLEWVEQSAADSVVMFANKYATAKFKLEPGDLDVKALTLAFCDSYVKGENPNTFFAKNGGATLKSGILSVPFSLDTTKFDGTLTAGLSKLYTSLDVTFGGKTVSSDYFEVNMAAPIVIDTVAANIESALEADPDKDEAVFFTYKKPLEIELNKTLAIDSVDAYVLAATNVDLDNLAAAEYHLRSAEELGIDGVTYTYRVLNGATFAQMDKNVLKFKSATTPRAVLDSTLKVEVTAKIKNAVLGKDVVDVNVVAPKLDTIKAVTVDFSVNSADLTAKDTVVAFVTFDQLVEPAGLRNLLELGNSYELGSFNGNNTQVNATVSKDTIYFSVNNTLTIADSSAVFTVAPKNVNTTPALAITVNYTVAHEHVFPALNANYLAEDGAVIAIGKKDEHGDWNLVADFAEMFDTTFVAGKYTFKPVAKADSALVNVTATGIEFKDTLTTASVDVKIKMTSTESNIAVPCSKEFTVRFVAPITMAFANLELQNDKNVTVAEVEVLKSLVVMAGADTIFANGSDAFYADTTGLAAGTAVKNAAKLGLSYNRVQVKAKLNEPVVGLSYTENESKATWTNGGKDLVKDEVATFKMEAYYSTNETNTTGRIKATNDAVKLTIKK